MANKMATAQHYNWMYLSISHFTVWQLLAYAFLVIFVTAWRQWKRCIPYPWLTFSRSNISNANNYETVRAISKMLDTAFKDFIFVIEWRYCERSIPWTWPTFSRSTISNVNISETVRASTKMCNMTFIAFFAIEWLHAKVVLRDLDIFFLGQIFQILFSRKGRELEMTFDDFDFCHRMVPLRK